MIERQRPRPTPIMHFTDWENLPGIASGGLAGDNQAQGSVGYVRDIGNRGIKDRRRTKDVPVGAKGKVADYVPFYFAPRSPMMYALMCGRVPEFTGSILDFAYLVTSVERLLEFGLTVVLSDRNASMDVVEFSVDPLEWDRLVDWPLMNEIMWNSTGDDPDRRERRMAECLVHPVVPWEAFDRIVVADNDRRAVVSAVLGSLGDTIPVDVDRHWYF